MNRLPIIVLAALITVSTVQAQSSESTQEWPAWKKVTIGVLGASSVLVTVGALAASSGGNDNADGSQTNSDGSDSGESNSNAGERANNDRKGQAFVEELKDELLVLVNNASRLLVEEQDGQVQLDELADEYPILTTYYRELMDSHPEVIAAVEDGIDGTSLVDRLNRVMIVHLFGDGAPVVE